MGEITKGQFVQRPGSTENDALETTFNGQMQTMDVRVREGKSGSYLVNVSTELAIHFTNAPEEDPPEPIFVVDVGLAEECIDHYNPFVYTESVHRAIEVPSSDPELVTLCHMTNRSDSRIIPLREGRKIYPMVRFKKFPDGYTGVTVKVNKLTFNIVRVGDIPGDHVAIDK